MITEEERESIINEAVERALLLVPETVGSMMANQATLHRINKEFYSKYPEFSNHKNTVMSVVEMVEGRSPLDSYNKILEKAVPKIRERINALKKLDIETISPNPNRQYEPLNAPKIDSNGII